MLKCLKVIQSWMLRRSIMNLSQKNIHHKLLANDGSKRHSSAVSSSVNTSLLRPREVPASAEPKVSDRAVKCGTELLGGPRDTIIDQSSSPHEMDGLSVLRVAADMVLNNTQISISIHTLLSAVNSLSLHQNFHLLTHHELTYLISLFGSYALLSYPGKLDTSRLPIRLAKQLPPLDSVANVRCWNALTTLIMAKKQSQNILANEDLFWLSFHELLRFEASDPVELQVRYISSLVEQLKLIDEHDITSYILRRLTCSSNPMGVRVTCRYLSGLLSQSMEFPQSYISILASILSKHASILTDHDKETLLSSIGLNTAKHSESSQAPPVTKTERKRVELLQLADEAQLAIFSRSQLKCSSPSSYWIKAEVDASLSSGVALDRKWNFLRHILLPNYTKEDLFEPSALNSSQAILSTIEVVSILSTWEISRQKNARWAPTPDDARELWSIFYAHCSSLDAPKINKCSLKSILLSFLRLSLISQDRQLCVRVTQASADLEAFSSDDHIENLLDCGAEFASVAVAFGTRSWEQIFKTLELAGIHLGKARQGLASKLVLMLARQDPIVAHELYKSAASESFRVNTSKALTFLMQSCLRKGELGRAISCAADGSAPIRLRWHMVNSIVDHIVECDVRRLNPESAAMLGETMSLVVQQCRLQPEHRKGWERTLQLIQDSCFLDVGSTAVQHILLDNPKFWTQPFLRRFFWKLSREFPQTAAELALRMPRGRIDHLWLRFRILECITLGRHPQNPQVARQLWSSLTPFEKSKATLFQRILAAVNFEYRHPATPNVLAAPRLILASPRITERDLNLTLQLLVRADLNGLARRVLRRVQAMGQLPTPAPSTTTLNILLGSALRPDSSFRGPRQMGKVTHFFRELFIQNNVPPDAVTLNMMLKCALRWKSIDSGLLRKLFDQCIISGYPGWHEPGLPFDNVPVSSKSDTMSMDTSSLQQWEGFDMPIAAAMVLQNPRISYERHVQPLYKMFIKAFTIRGDHSAAHVVVQVLKRARLKSDAGDRNM